MNRGVLLLPMAVAAVAVAGCGGGSKTTDTSAGGSATAPTSAGAATQTTGGATTTKKKTGTTTKKAGGGSAQAAEGKRIFTSAGCGSCHTLSAAGSNGNVGPNLDQLQPDQTTVAAQVRRGGGGMPSFSGRLSSAQIQAVAAYVAKVAGQ